MKPVAAVVIATGTGGLREVDLDLTHQLVAVVLALTAHGGYGAAAGLNAGRCLATALPNGPDGARAVRAIDGCAPVAPGDAARLQAAGASKGKSMRTLQAEAEARPPPGVVRVRSARFLAPAGGVPPREGET